MVGAVTVTAAGVLSEKAGKYIYSAYVFCILVLITLLSNTLVTGQLKMYMQR